MVLTTTDHTAAALDALRAVLPDSIPAVRVDDAADLETNYVQVTTVRRFLADPRFYPSTSMRLWRLTCEYVASTVGNADTIEAACHTALEGVELLISDEITTPIQHETTEPTVQDRDRRWSGFVDFTYAI